MLTNILISGSGGQGIQFMGQVLALAAVRQGLQTTYVPAYGAERRGGTSFCSVVIADEPIYAPVFGRPDVLLAFDQRGRDQYGSQVKDEGLILTNADLAATPAAGETARVLSLPASTLADRSSQDGGTLNLVMLGAFVAASRILDQEQVLAALAERSTKKPERLAANREGFAAGAAWAAQEAGA